MPPLVPEIRTRRAGFFRWYAECDIPGLPGRVPRYTASLGPFLTERRAWRAMYNILRSVLPSMWANVYRA